MSLRHMLVMKLPEIIDIMTRNCFDFHMKKKKRPTHKVGQVYTKIDIKPSGLTKKD